MSIKAFKKLGLLKGETWRQISGIKHHDNVISFCCQINVMEM
jgi:hypothetical protein